MRAFYITALYIIISIVLSQNTFALSQKDIPRLQATVSNKPVGERIAFWAKQFINTPYDTDPIGEYVRKNKIVVDERVDCMYLTFRVVELAHSSNPEDAVEEALNRRFFTKGIVVDNKVTNYYERFQYGMDMILSNKWGKDVTEELGQTIYVEGARGWDKQKILPSNNTPEWIKNLRSGDIIFFVKPPKKRVVGEIIGHIGIIDNTSNKIYLIHASGSKKKDSKGKVKRVRLKKYFKTTGFIGAKVTRF